MGSLFPGLHIAKDPSVDTWNTWWTEEKPELPTSAYICPDCVTDAHVEVEEEEAICGKCGHSFGYEVTSSAEYRWFGADDRSPDPTRVGNPMNPLLPESSLGTRIVARPGES